MRNTVILSVLGMHCTAACSTSTDALSGSAPPNEIPTETPDDGVLDPLEDGNPDEGILEVDLEAKPSTKVFGEAPPTPLWTYNGTLPGPLLDAKVGTRLRVHFQNSLPESTTIHWHGIRLPAAMDGSLATQRPIAPGERFDYEFTLKDPGLYWFHPHQRSDVQVNRGLYGVIRVRGDFEPAADQERVLVLDDLKLKADGTIPEYLDDSSKMMGRGGPVILVNGKTNATLRVRPQGTLRLRIVNVANGRFFNLALPGRRLHVVGTDGGLAVPYDTERLLVAPGERYDVLVQLPAERDAALELQSLPYDRGHHSDDEPAFSVAKILLDGPPVVNPKPLAWPRREMERLPVPTELTPLVLDEVSLPTGDLAFTINGEVGHDLPPLMVRTGEVRGFDIRNASEMDHPFHLHGFFFQVLERNGRPTGSDELANKDTLVVPMKSSLKLVARFDEPGMWMYHCHILEHAELGMMGEIHVQ